jgi:hypothetical protein
MMSGPERERAARAADRGRLRASHADRNRVVDVLKAAFVEGRLTKDELDARVGQTLAARTYAELAVLTADIPPGTKLARRPRPDRAPAPQPAHRAVKSGAAAIAGIVIAASVTAAAIGQPQSGVILAVFILILAAVASALVGSIVGAALMIESRRQRRSRRQTPTRPSSGAGGQPSQHPSSPGPFPPGEPGQPFTAEAARISRPRPIHQFQAELVRRVREASPDRTSSRIAAHWSEWRIPSVMSYCGRQPSTRVARSVRV